MFNIFLLATVGVTVAFALKTWSRFRDPLHPAIFIAPLFAYSYAVEPWLLRTQLGNWFKHENDLMTVITFNFLAISALGFGMVRAISPRVATAKAGVAKEVPLEQLFAIAVVLSFIAVGAYFYALDNVGGFVAAYSKAKGGGRAASGYFGEAVNLGLVAALFVGMARRGKGLTAGHWALIIFAVSPVLLHGTFGGRRGPLFLSLGAAMLSAVLAARRPPTLGKLMGGVVGISFAVLFIWSQREHLHLGSSDASIRWEKLKSFAIADEADQGNNFIYGSAFILTAMKHEDFTWGKELMVNLLVRPIPKQLWPTKYEDVGATWITEAAPGYGNFSAGEWISAVGWQPLSGSSAGTLSDLFGEFSWYAIGFLYFLGRLFASLYNKHRTLGGVWTILLLEMLCLTIYLATQSFSSFYHRFLILAVPTIILWRFYAKTSPGAGDARLASPHMARLPRGGPQRARHPAFPPANTPQPLLGKAPGSVLRNGTDPGSESQ